MMPTEVHCALEAGTQARRPPTLPCPTARPGPPDEEEDGFAIVGPIHDPGGAQEGPQDLHQPWGQLVHLIEEEQGASTGCEVALDPAPQILLGRRGWPDGHGGEVVLGRLVKPQASPQAVIRSLPREVLPPRAASGPTPQPPPARAGPRKASSSGRRRVGPGLSRGASSQQVQDGYRSLLLASPGRHS